MENDACSMHGAVQIAVQSKGVLLVMAEQKPRARRGAASKSLSIRLTTAERRMIDNLVKRAQKAAGPGHRVTQRQVILMALESVSDALERYLAHGGAAVFAEQMRKALDEQEQQEQPTATDTGLSG